MKAIKINGAVNTAQTRYNQNIIVPIISDTKDKVKKVIEVKYIDSDRFKELSVKWVHGLCTKRESLYLRSVLNMIEKKSAKVYLNNDIDYVQI